MKPTQSFTAALLTIGLFVPISFARAREIQSLDAAWSFFQGAAAGAEKPGFDTSTWQKLDVPHDWSIGGNFSKDALANGSGAWLPTGVVWYRKDIPLPADATGKRVWVEFDGVMANSDVWLNGHLLGHRPSGYASFHYDITEQLKPGSPNTLVVRADTSAQPASRWYAGTGIYRQVRLVTAPPVRVEPWGVYVTTTEASANSATVKIQTTIANSSGKSGKITLRTALVGRDGKTLATVATDSTLPPDQSAAIDQEIKIPHPQLWSVESPQLNKLVTRIIAGDTVLNEVTTPFGIRTAEFRSDTGFCSMARI